MLPPPPRSTLFPYTTLFRSALTISRPNSAGSFEARVLTFSDAGRTSDSGKLGYVAGLLIGNLEARSEEHTSELQSRENLVCRLLLEKKKKNRIEIVKMT